MTERVRKKLLRIATYCSASPPVPPVTLPIRPERPPLGPAPNALVSPMICDSRVDSATGLMITVALYHLVRWYLDTNPVIAAAMIIGISIVLGRRNRVRA